MARRAYCLVEPNESVDDLSRRFAPEGLASTFVDELTNDDAPRTGWSALLATVQPGDEVVVNDLSELGSTMKELFASLSQLSKSGVQLLTLADLDAKRPARGESFYSHALEIEECLNRISSRKIKKSVSDAKKKGGNHGRPRKITKEIFETLLTEAGASDKFILEVAKMKGFTHESQLREIQRLDEALLLNGVLADEYPIVRDSSDREAEFMKAEARLRASIEAQENEEKERIQNLLIEATENPTKKRA